jgi:hypothetical protein
MGLQSSVTLDSSALVIARCVTRQNRGVNIIVKEKAGRLVNMG